MGGGRQDANFSTQLFLPHESPNTVQQKVCETMAHAIFSRLDGHRQQNDLCRVCPVAQVGLERSSPPQHLEVATNPHTQPHTHCLSTANNFGQLMADMGVSRCCTKPARARLRNDALEYAK